MAAIEHAPGTTQFPLALSEIWAQSRKVLLPVLLMVLLLGWWEFVAQAGMVSVEVHCLRPLLPANTPAWNKAFDSACDGVLASLKK